jgi:hypothetical protein
MVYNLQSYKNKRKQPPALRLRAREKHENGSYCFRRRSFKIFVVPLVFLSWTTLHTNFMVMRGLEGESASEIDWTAYMYSEMYKTSDKTLSKYQESVREEPKVRRSPNHVKILKNIKAARPQRESSAPKIGLMTDMHKETNTNGNIQVASPADIKVARPQRESSAPKIGLMTDMHKETNTNSNVPLASPTDIKVASPQREVNAPNIGLTTDTHEETNTNSNILVALPVDIMVARPQREVSAPKIGLMTDMHKETNTNSNVTHKEKNTNGNVPVAPPTDMQPVRKEPNVKQLRNQHKHVDPILQPIIQSGGMMYSMCRLDRSGSFILEMLHAHAFAFHNNLTYAGNCCVSSGVPREDTLNILKNLQWDKILPFACPDGVDSMKYNFHWPLPNATEISPLILNGNVFRKNSNFRPAWRESIRKELLKQIQINANDTDVAMKMNDKPYEIAVHVRRGDATPCTNLTHVQRRYLPNSYYISLVEQYTPTEQDLNGRSVHVTIYSESDSFEVFDAFEQRGYDVHLDTENLADVWRAIANADVAILSRSFFSMVPATVNPNIVVATKFYYLLEGWKDVNHTLVEQSDELVSEMAKSMKCNVATQRKK